MDWKADRVVA